MLSGRGADAKQPHRQIGDAEMNEVRLMRMIAAGDRHAFDSLYRAYFHRLRRFLDRMTHSVTTIEEVVNDTMLVVWRRAATFDGSCKVSTWIFAIAFRTALKAVKYLEEPLDFDEMLHPSEDTQTPEAILSRKELQHQVEQAVRLLPFEQRIVVSLTYYHGADYAEIAQIMGCPLNTVKTRMFLARKRLKDLLDNHWGDV
jgi:RNA polymerase sigma-70 factor (ECF subfamily)